MKRRLLAVCEVLGAGAVAFGFGLAWVPLGFIVGGSLLVVGSSLAEQPARKVVENT